jgi:hypothetical protein
MTKTIAIQFKAPIRPAENSERHRTKFAATATSETRQTGLLAGLEEKGA